MISQLTSFDQLLPPTAPLTSAATVTQSNGDSGGATVISSEAATVIDEKHCRKRKRHSASNGNNSNNNNGGSASSSSSSASADGVGPSPKLAGVEQQLAASSPSLFLQQALRHNFVEDGMPGGRGVEQQSTGTTMDFFEAHKAFQKLSSQLSAGFTDSTASPALAQPGMNPFVQQLATLSPFLLALQHQSQQFVQAQAQQHQFDPTSLLSIPPIHNENLFHHVASSPRGYAKDDEEEEEDDEQRGHSAENALGEPEDLSLKHESRSDAHHNNGGNQLRNGTPSWSYEEQFKQLYELSPTDLRRKEWLDDWLEFMRRIGKPVTRIPIMAKQVLDLYELYRLVVHHGGLVEVITKKLWREIAKGLSLPTSITSAAFTLRTQYEKYLFDFECERHHFSTLADLRSAIDANKREGGRRNAPAAAGAGAPHGTTSNSAGATPSGHHHQHNHHHSYSGGRHSSSNSMDSHRERHVQQQQMRWLEQMAASFGAAPPPPPPVMAAAFFGKHLLQFGTSDAVPTTPTAREEENLLNGNRTTSSTTQPLPQFAGEELLQFGHQNGADRQQFDSIFPKIEIATGRTSTSPRAFSSRQSSSACPRRCHGTAVSSPATSSYHCPTAEHHRQSPNSPSAEKRRKPNEVPPPAAPGNVPSPILGENAAEGISVAPLGSFGHLLKNASRCSIKLSNGGETKNAENNAGTLSQTTTTTVSETTASSMVVSMELNGILYQGVLFAMPTAERETEETERQKEC